MESGGADRAAEPIAPSVLQCIAERGLAALTVSELAVAATGLAPDERRAVRELAWRLLAVDDAHAGDTSDAEPSVELSAAVSLGALRPAY